MEMKFALGGFGIGVRGVNITGKKFASLFFRDGPGEGAVGIVIEDGLEAGASGPNAGWSGVLSEWISINPAKHTWLFDPLEHVGKLGKIEVAGSAVFIDEAMMNLKLEIVNRHHQLQHAIEWKQIPIVKGSYQIGGFSVQGQIKQAAAADLAVFEEKQAESGALS